MHATSQLLIKKKTRINILQLYMSKKADTVNIYIKKKIVCTTHKLYY